MRHFATESGKRKGQFYTPAEVSRIMAQIIGIRNAKTSAATAVYDPTCGSGSLLLKVGDEAGAAAPAGCHLPQDSQQRRLSSIKSMACLIWAFRQGARLKASSSFRPGALRNSLRICSTEEATLCRWSAEMATMGLTWS